MAMAVAATAAGLLLATTVAIFVVPRLSLYRATGAQHAVLRKPVSRLDGLDVLAIIFLILLKSLQRMLGLAPVLRPSPDGTGFDLPALSVTSTVAIDDRDLLRFEDATSPTRSRGHVGSVAPRPLSSLHESDLDDDDDGLTNRSLLLAGLVNPLMSILLANRSLPIQPFGCVNTGNSFTFVDPEACRCPTQVLDLTRGVTVSASLGGPGRRAKRVKRGVEFEVHLEVAALRNGDTSPTVIFKQVGGVLAFLPRSTKPVYNDRPSGPSTASATEATAENEQREEEGEQDGELRWTSADDEIVELGAGAPGSWAALCRDYNPIHVSSVLARLFGFPGKIAHGNHTLARAVELIARDPRRVLAGIDRGAEKARALLRRREAGDGRETTGSLLRVRFRRPIVLPSRLGLEVADLRDGFALRVVREGKEYLTARWTKI